MDGEVHESLKKKFPDILTLIVPRHPKRGDDITEKLRASGLGVAQRSQNEPLDSKTDIYLADTLGEMGLFYYIAPIVVMGGSFIEHGGQNPIEPTHLDCAILYGPHMFNFKEICAELEEAQAAKPLENKEALITALTNLLTDKKALEQQQVNAKAVGERNLAVIDKILDAIEPALEKGLSHHKEAA